MYEANQEIAEWVRDVVDKMGLPEEKEDVLRSYGENLLK